jgi:hypothetical protein
MFRKIVVSVLLSVSALSALDRVLDKDVLERIIQPRVSYETSYLSDADVSGSNGGVAVQKNRLQLNNEIVGLSYTNWAFDWSNVAALPFGNGAEAPLEQMHNIRLNVTLPYAINEKWFTLTQLSASSTFEREMDDSYGGGFFSFASYKLDEDHSIQMGAFANYHPVRTFGLPVMSYSYRARSRDGVQLILGFPRAYVGYFINPKTLLRAGMIFSQSVIKLSRDSTLQNDGYVEAKDYMSNLGLSYELSDSFRIEGDLLYSIKRDFILYNAAGQEQKSYGIDPSVGVNLRLRYLF